MPCNNAELEENIFTPSKCAKSAGLSGRVNRVGDRCDVNECDRIPNTLVNSEDKNTLSSFQCKFLL
jgi:hypothetical protein